MLYRFVGLSRRAMMLMLFSAFVGGGHSEQVLSAEWTLGRTPDGQPDLQGVWANNSATPVERPRHLADTAEFSDEELAGIKARYTELFESGASDAAFADSVFEAVLGNSVQFTSRDTSTGNYNQFWMVGREFEKRTSLIVDPVDGRIPPLTAVAQAQLDLRAKYLESHPADTWEDRRLSERCVTFGLPNLFAGYNTYYQILQTPEYFVILSEMIHDVRIIPLDGRVPIGESIDQWHGDSRGWWENETLVVETANFSTKSESPFPLYRRVRPSGKNLRLVERFTRVGPNTIEHEFTVEDGTTFTQPWSVMIPLKKSEDPLFEYACHEGNVGMVGILAGHRAQE